MQKLSAMRNERELNVWLSSGIEEFSIIMLQPQRVRNCEVFSSENGPEGT